MQDTNLSLIEKKWLEGFDESERMGALAWLHYKRTTLDRHKTLSRPQLFIEAFELGRALRERAEAPPEPNGCA